MFAWLDKRGGRVVQAGTYVRTRVAHSGPRAALDPLLSFHKKEIGPGWTRAAHAPTPHRSHTSTLCWLPTDWYSKAGQRHGSQVWKNGDLRQHLLG